MKTVKKILLSAYACEPFRGSEPGIGWNWAIELAKDPYLEIHVITRSNNKSRISDFFKENDQPRNLFFYYYDLPRFMLFIKKHGLGVNVYYKIWQLGILPLAKRIHKENKIDIVHHLTFGVFRDPSFLYKLNLPLIFGPLGGGDYTPKTLRRIYPLKYQLKEFLRYVVNSISLMDPFLRRLLSKSSIILVKSLENKSIIPQKFHHKTYNILEIGIHETVDYEPKDSMSNVFLYVGRFIYLKGIDIILHSFKQYVHQYDSSALLVLIGEGDYQKKIENYIIENHFEKNVQIISWMKQDMLKKYYLESCALLFPSLHDSSGNVVLEALSYGLPVITLDCGGPVIVQGDLLTEMIVATKGMSFEQVYLGVTEKMHQIHSDREFNDKIRNLSIQRANEFLWSTHVPKTYDFLFQKIFNQY